MALFPDFHPQVAYDENSATGAYDSEQGKLKRYFNDSLMLAYWGWNWGWKSGNRATKWQLLPSLRAEELFAGAVVREGENDAGARALFAG